MLLNVKRTAFGLAAIVFATTAAQADGMPRGKYVGAAPFSWTGFYIGGHAGYGWGESDWTDLNGNLGANVRFEDLQGAIGGGQVGYNWQSGPLVLGVEGTITGGSVDQTGTVGSASLTTDVEWMATVVGRLGYAFDRSMIYVKGGYATASIELKGDNGADTFSASERHNGWTVGAGWEYAFVKNLTLGVEYNYYDFGSERYAITTANGLALDIDADTQVHSLLARLNVKFGDDRHHAPLK